MSVPVFNDMHKTMLSSTDLALPLKPNFVFNYFLTTTTLKARSQNTVIKT